MKIKELLNEDWNKVNKRDKTDGLSQKAVNAYRRENPGSKLKTAVTTKPSKLKAGSKDAKRRKSFCARMSGNKGPMKKPNGKPTPKALALRRWNCESVEQMAQMITEGEQLIAEIKKGQKDSNGFTKCWAGKHAEGTKKGKNGKPVRNCVPNESVEQGVAEGSLNEFAPDGFNGGNDGEEFNPRLAKMAYDEGVVKGVSLADGATLQRAMAINDWDKHDGGIYKQHFAKGFKAGRMNKINHGNKQYNLNLKLMKDGSIRHGEQGVAEGSEKRCMQCGMPNCTCAPGKCKCKPIAGWIPNKGFKKQE